MPLPLLMAIGAGIGAVAGVGVYGAKVISSKKVDWSWRDAGAHAVGGLVGGGLFPLVMAGLGAAGLPAAAAYVVAGGLSWGGLWSLAQDGASWALGRREGLASPKKYLIATAIGLAVSALLLPIAGRAIGPGMKLAPPPATTAGYLRAPSTAANLVRAEGEFLAYGAMSEGANTGIRTLGRAGLKRGLRMSVTEASTEVGEGILSNSRRVMPTLAPRGADGIGEAAESEAAELPSPTDPTPTDPSDSEQPSPFGRWADRVAVGVHSRRDVGGLEPAHRRGVSAALGRTQAAEMATR